MVDMYVISLLGAAVLAALTVFLIGPWLIPELHKLKFGQSIREEGPKSHQAKSGTPTMGGMMIMAGIVMGTLVFAPLNLQIGLMLFIMLGHFALGFLDDYIKVVLKRNLGLKAREKLLGQFIIAVVVSYIGIHFNIISTSIWIPFTDISINLGIFYYLLVLGVLIGATNAVNLTDGLDGLASGAMSIAAAAYMVICYLLSDGSLAIFAATCVGACLAFLKFNYNPAKVFMGDTGSLALGGVLAGFGILTNTELLLVILGGLFVIETLSVIIQVISFKTRGKRVFLMSPIHHHFELKGWNEKQVVWRFWGFELLCCIVAIFSLCWR